MDNLDDSENNQKISDSAYSNSCSNSQSRRSHSSKSTHSGSSGSSGYGGNPSTSGSSTKLEQTSKKSKDSKKRQPIHTDARELPAVLECTPPEPLPNRDVPKDNAIEAMSALALPENAVRELDTLMSEFISHKQEIQTVRNQTAAVSLDTSCQAANDDSTGFSCAISMHDGLVMYTTQNLTTNLGFPKDMWLGRIFMDFVHPKDHTIFASQLTNRLLPTTSMCPAVQAASACDIANRPMVCRIRQYRSLNAGFGIKESMVTYIPFSLKFSIKDINEDDGSVVYMIIQATPVYSSYKTSNECITDAKPFVLKHSAAGLLEYIDIESVPYLGYFPQDIQNQNVLLMYHPDDLPYLRTIYETIVKDGKVAKSMPYRMLTNNGEYVKLETEWSSFINPWTMKLEFIVGKHQVVEGPATPDVFKSPAPAPAKLEDTSDMDDAMSMVADANRKMIEEILMNVHTKPEEKAKQPINKRRQELAEFMDNLLNDQAKAEKVIKVDIPEPKANADKDLALLGGISPHYDSDGKSSTETFMSYNQLNFNENLQRYFESHRYVCGTEKPPQAVTESPHPSPSPSTQNIVESNDTVKTSSAPNNDCSPPVTMSPSHCMRLTESLLNKHNTDMAKKLAKDHRETRALGTSRCIRVNDSKQKKIEHLARCNASFQPTSAGTAAAATQKGVKRGHTDVDDIFKKQQCTTSRRMSRHINQADDLLPSITGVPIARKTFEWQSDFGAGEASSSIFDMGVQQSFPVPPMPADVLEATATNAVSRQHSEQQQSQQEPQYSSGTSVYPLFVKAAAVKGPAILSHSPVLSPRSAKSRSEILSHSPVLTPLSMTTRSYSSPSIMNPTMSRPMEPFSNTSKFQVYPQPEYKAPFMYSQVYGMPQTSAVMPPPPPRTIYNSSMNQLGLQKNNNAQNAPVALVSSESSIPSGLESDETIDKTDEESSFSSFYSSFVNTDSGSGADSSDKKKTFLQPLPRPKTPTINIKGEPYDPNFAKKPVNPKAPIDPKLIYKYQIKTRPQKEVLEADIETMKNLKQPDLVNKQLGQLYLEMQLNGVAPRLTLEEGITSSSSSGEDNVIFCVPAPRRAPRRRRHDFNKLSMIYEENAPFPPPPEVKDSPVSN